MAEIEAFRMVWPEGKHQTCFWHAIRTVEERLAENRPTAAYDPERAHQYFSFISPTWKPDQQKGMENGRLEMESGGIRPVIMDSDHDEEELKLEREVCYPGAQSIALHADIF